MSLPKDPSKRTYLFSDDIKFLQKIMVFHPAKRRKFLALKRTLDDRSRAGCWDLVGGNVHFGEIAEESIVREIEEETGLSVVNVRPVKILTRFDIEKQFYFIYIGYLCVALGSDVVLSKEHIEYQWVTKKEFAHLDTGMKKDDFLKETVNAIAI